MFLGRRVGVAGGEGVGVRVQERIQLSCGYVDIDRMIAHDDNPNQGYFFFIFIYLFFFFWGGG